MLPPLCTCNGTSSGWTQCRLSYLDLACICESHQVPRLRYERDKQDDDASLTAVDPVLDQY